MFSANPKRIACALAATALVINPCQAEVTPEYIARQEELKAAKVAQEVAIYGYPLVMMSLLKQYGTYTRAPNDYKAPINQFSHQKSQSTPLDEFAYPSIDVLTSNAWLDLADGPFVLHVPAVYKRFFLFEVFDGWTNVITTIDASLTDSTAKDFMFCGPNFKGTVPKNVTQIRAATNMVYIKGFTQCFGPEDYKALHDIQNGYTLTPLASFGQAYSPPAMIAVQGPIASKEAPADQLTDMSFISFFDRLQALLKTNPPGLQDVAPSKSMNAIGINTDKPFEAEDTNRALENGLEDAFANALEKINSSYTSVYSKRGQWKMIFRKERDFGTDYLRRALLARALLPTSLSQNMLSITTESDYDGIRLNGMRNYQLHITKEEMPPVKAFWSLTLYTDSQQLVYNQSNIYAIQSFADSLKFNKDGSCDIFIQNEKPTESGVNWLPCPKGNFSLMLRLYQPDNKVLDGEWMPPAIRCLDSIEL